MRVLRSAFARPTLSEDEATDLIDYYLDHNAVAHESHRKSWLAKHKELAEKPLLRNQRRSDPEPHAIRTLETIGSFPPDHQSSPNRRTIATPVHPLVGRFSYRWPLVQ